MAATRTALRPAQIAQDDLTAWLDGYTSVYIDIGTGDGAFALQVARMHPETAVIGIDTCLDNLTKAARKPVTNLRFLSCDATAIPSWLAGRATGISINFPYGSLLHAVAGEDGEQLKRLLHAAREGAEIDIRINASACQDHGLELDTMRRQVERTLRTIAPRSTSVNVITHDAIRTFPSTWAKRLAYGRPSQVIVATATMGL